MSNKPILPDSPTIADVEKYEKDSKAWMDTRPLKSIHTVATNGSITQRGGKVFDATGTILFGDDRVARVGDSVRYPDGTIAEIVSGTGARMLNKNIPLAITGSVLDNGDVIVDTHSKSGIQTRIYADEPLPEGFLVAGWLPKPTTTHKD